VALLLTREGCGVRAEQIETRRINYGVGVLRGVLSRPELMLVATREIEAAIEHIRGAARLVERLQREIGRTRRAKRTRRSR